MWPLERQHYKFYSELKAILFHSCIYFYVYKSTTWSNTDMKSTFVKRIQYTNEYLTLVGTNVSLVDPDSAF